MQTFIYWTPSLEDPVKWIQMEAIRGYNYMITENHNIMKVTYIFLSKNSQILNNV